MRLAHRRSTGRDPAEGFGLVIREDYQIDLAVDLSDPVSTVSFSIVKFF